MPKKPNDDPERALFRTVFERIGFSLKDVWRFEDYIRELKSKIGAHQIDNLRLERQLVWAEEYLTELKKPPPKEEPCQKK